MICPHCKTKITQVDAYSECLQIAEVDAKGVITDYGSVENISDECIDVECPECHESIIDHIKKF